MATSCQRGCTVVIDDLHSNALTKISNLHLGMEVHNGRHMHALMDPVEAVCNALSCPPYNSYKEINCAMCTM